MAITNMLTESERETDPCPPWLIEALYETVHRSAIRAPRMAETMGCSVDLLYAYATSPHNASGKHAHLPFYRVEPLIKASMNYTLLDMTEARVGRSAIPIAHQPQFTLAQQASHVLQCGLDLMKMLAQSLGQGQTPVAAGRSMLPFVDALIKELCHFKHELTLREAAEG